MGTGSYVTTLVITQSGDIYAVPEHLDLRALVIAGIAAVVSSAAVARPSLNSHQHQSYHLFI